jgi:hypothetical protein
VGTQRLGLSVGCGVVVVVVVGMPRWESAGTVVVGVGQGLQVSKCCHSDSFGFPGLPFTAKAEGRKNNRSPAGERMPRAGWRGRPRESDGVVLTESQRRRVMSQSTSMPGSSKASRELRFSSVACAMLGWHATSGGGEKRDKHMQVQQKQVVLSGQREKCKNRQGLPVTQPPPSSTAGDAFALSQHGNTEGGVRPQRQKLKIVQVAGCTYRCPS